MNKSNLKDFIRGWIVGDFNPSIIKTKDFEIAIKEYKKGDKEKAHYHKLAVEYTIVISGSVRMNKEIYNENDIIEVEKNEVIEFEALADCKTVCLKIPSIIGDKFEV